jgi:hypothetical protein
MGNREEGAGNTEKGTGDMERVVSWRYMGKQVHPAIPSYLVRVACSLFPVPYSLFPGTDD